MIIDSIRVNNELGFYYGENKNTAKIIISDSLERVWEFENNKKILWFDFTLAEQDSYFYDIDDTALKYIVKISRNVKVETKFGTLDSCLIFLFDDPDAIDEEHYFTFAPGIGLIEEGTGMGISWKLDSAYINGEIITKVRNRNKNGPLHFNLKQNHPNPFNLTTKIPLTLERNFYINLSIFNIRGEQIKILLNQICIAGDYSTEFDSSNLSSGLYFIVLKTDEQLLTRKMILAK